MHKFVNRFVAFLLVTILSVTAIKISAFAVDDNSIVLGDVNQDGSVTTKDALLVLRYSAKLEALSESQISLGDYDNDGDTDIEDARRILQFVTLDGSYEQELYDMGFPASYVELLLELHAQYPEWEFKPFITGLDWQKSVDGEREPHNQQLIEKSVKASFKCDCSKCDGVIQEASSWVSASEEAVKYYMDPRNFLTEEYIFQFESTAYSSSHTKAGVEAILSGTWMEDSYITYLDGNGDEKTYRDENNKKVKYSEAILKAAKDNKMSAYYLASKIVQEVGSSKSSYAGGSSGKNAPYYGIYNYYNIGAYTGVADGLEWANGYLKAKGAAASLLKEPKSDAEKVATIPKNSEKIYFIAEEGSYYYVSTVIEGKTYKGYVLRNSVSPSTTYGRPWDNPYKSIYYGAEYIYNSFSKYQYTGYLQKFNVNSESGSLYNHEYMANVRAAASEAKHTYEAYVDAKIINSKKTFVIPVFKNMPGADMTRDDVFKSAKPEIEATSYNTKSITISWTEVKNAESYRIYKLNQETGKYSKIATVDADVLSYKDSLASEASKASYRVRAYTTAKDGKTIYSKYNTFQASTPTSAPTGLTVTAKTDNSVSLKWSAVENCDGYAVYRYDTITDKYSKVGTSTTTTFTDKTVLSGTSYKYKVRTYIDLSQNFYSAYSGEVSAKTTGDAVTQIGEVDVSDVLNVRADASTDSAILVQLKAGTKVYIIKRVDDWYKITFTLDGETYTGYASSEYIKVTNSDVTREACPYKEPSSTLKNGNTGEGVKWLQWHLYKLSYLKESDIDGDFGPTTLAAVKKYQTDKKLDVDGIVGSATRTQLKSDYANS